MAAWRRNQAAKNGVSGSISSKASAWRGGSESVMALGSGSAAQARKNQRNKQHQ